METIFSKIFLYVVIVLSAVFHEYSHAWMAWLLGDDTAKNEGRLTLNPLAHIDFLGTVLIPLILLFTAGGFIGWAKPVPYNPHNLRDQKYGNLKVALAGPGANLVIALVLGFFIRLAVLSRSSDVIFGNFIFILSLVVLTNITLALFNLIPFPPLDGSKIMYDLFPRVWLWSRNLGLVGILLALLAAPYFIFPFANFIFRLITGIGFGI